MEQLLAGFQLERYMNESNIHTNEKNSKVVQVCNYRATNNLKELIKTTYTSNMNILLDNSLLKNTTLLSVFDLEEL